MTALNKINDGVREALDVLAEGWQDLWHKARNAITRFTPPADGQTHANNRWGLLSAELHEGGDNISINIEAPGLNKEAFEIFVKDQTLSVRGTKQASSEREEGRYHISERAYGSFERIFPLPTDVDEDRTTASYRNGVLTVELQKSSKAQPRIISIS
jgi:HSP20 family protein